MAKTVAMMLAAVLLMSAFASSSAAALSYGAIDNGDFILGNPTPGAPANAYQRGCDKAEQCRGRKLLADLRAAGDVDLKQRIINFFH